MSQYFENDKTVKSERRNIKFKFKDREYNFISDNGVFSKDKFDYGTRTLLDSIDINTLSGNVLDLGCGIGVVGIILKSINNNINIDMVDINERALDLAKENLRINNIDNHIFKSDVYDSITNKYNYIITNPPIRAGKAVVRKFLLDSYEYLDKEGILYFVMRKDHGVKSMIKELEDKFIINIINKDKGFYVVSCLKRDT